MAYTAKVVTEPANAVVSTADAKAYLRVDVSDDDDLIDSLVASATKVAERYLGRALITQTLELVTDGFPNESGLSVDFPRYGVRSWSATDFRSTLHLPFGAPLQSVGSITYLDRNGDQQTLAASLYRVDTDSEPGAVQPIVGEAWPATLNESGSVVVQYDAGYGTDATDVPAAIVQAIKEMTRRMYDRECSGDDCADDMAAALLAAYRVQYRG